jgi:hypothetical protein
MVVVTVDVLLWFRISSAMVVFESMRRFGLPFQWLWDPDVNVRTTIRHGGAFPGTHTRHTVVFTFAIFMGSFILDTPIFMGCHTVVVTFVSYALALSLSS